MEIKTQIDKLLAVVSKAQSIVERRSNMPILSAILLVADDGGIAVSATDLQMAFQETIEAEVISKGAVAISGRKLYEILKESGSSRRENEEAWIHIKGEANNWVHISDGRAKFRIAGYPPEEFPSFVEPEDCILVRLDAPKINEMIKKTIYAVTLEEAGFKLSGLFAEKIQKPDQASNGDSHLLLRMVGTDGHRLSLIDKEFEGLESLELPKGVMIPKKGVMEISKLSADGDVIEMGFKQNSCIVKKDSATLAIRLLDTKFPDYHAVIPKEMSHRAEINRLELLHAMKKMLILASDRYRAVKMAFDDSGLTLVSTNPELGEAEERIEVRLPDGEAGWSEGGVELAFNARYFVDVLQVMESEDIQLGFIDNSRPCVITGEADEGFLGLIMPMRL